VPREAISSSKNNKNVWLLGLG